MPSSVLQTIKSWFPLFFEKQCEPHWKQTTQSFCYPDYLTFFKTLGFRSTAVILNGNS